MNNNPLNIHIFKWITSESFNIEWAFQFDSLTVSFVNLLIFLGEMVAVLVLIQLYKLIFIHKFKVNTLDNLTVNKHWLDTKSVRSGNFTAYDYNTKRYYTTISDNSLNKMTLSSFDSNFLQWFVGFTDAEGNFSIVPRSKKDKSTVSTFLFMFKIGLHKDDEMILRLIKDKLSIGSVRIYKDECTFIVSDKKGIALLIDIFDKYHLNTTKYLDYLDFKEAYNLYHNNNSNNLKSDGLKDLLIELKNKMNTNRINFERPENSDIIITKDWLLGFIEGDGSFFLRRDNIVPTFSMELSVVQLSVLIKIKEFLENNLGFDAYSLYKLKNSSIIAVTTAKAKSLNSKGSVSITIKNNNVLHNYFIPFFEDRKFLTKKGMDFNDFKLISHAVYIGAHRDEKIRSLILELSNTMNNFRLSTYKETVKPMSQEEINQITRAIPTVENLLDGRVIDRITGKLLHRLVSCVYEIFEEDGSCHLANSLTEAASIVGLYTDTLSKYLDVEALSASPKIEFVKVKNYRIRRVRVFVPTE